MPYSRENSIINDQNSLIIYGFWYFGTETSRYFPLSDLGHKPDEVMNQVKISSSCVSLPSRRYLLIRKHCVRYENELIMEV
jgi:hypothetical protein